MCGGEPGPPGWFKQSDLNKIAFKHPLEKKLIVKEISRIYPSAKTLFMSSNKSFS